MLLYAKGRYNPGLLDARTAAWRMPDDDDWMRQAACRDVEDPTVFAIPLDAGQRMKARAQAAKAICAGCPVIEQCLQFALDGGESGIWGGTTEDERRQLRRVSA